MTLASIKAMFVPGSEWLCSRIGKPTTIVGNLGNTTLPANNIASLPRTVIKAKSEIVWMADGKRLYAPWPKASEVNEARDGFLKFTYDNGVVCIYERKPAA